MRFRLKTACVFVLGLMVALLASGQAANAVAAPVITSIVPSSTGADVTFAPVSGASSYTCSAVASSGTVTGTVTGNSCGLILGNDSYDVTVSALPGPVASAVWSGVRKNTPAAPTITSASVSGSTMTLAYLPPNPINGANSVLDYEIYVNGVRQPNAHDIQLGGPPFTSPLVFALNGSAGTSFTVQLAANNDVGLGIFSSYSVGGGGPVAAPAVVAAAAPGIVIDSVSSTSITYHLVAPSFDGGEGPFVYEVTGVGPITSMNPVQAAAGRTVTGLMPNTIYELKARDFNSGGWSDSAMKSVRTYAVPPGEPREARVDTFPDAVTGGRYALIQWKSPVNSPGAVLGYRLSTEPDLSCQNEGSVETGYCIIGPLSVGTTVTATVRSIGVDELSSPVSASTVIKPVAPAAPQMEVSTSRRAMHVIVRPTSDGGSAITHAVAAIKRISDGEILAGRKVPCAPGVSQPSPDSTTGSPSAFCFDFSLAGTATSDLLLVSQVVNAIGVSRTTSLEAFLVGDAPRVPAPLSVHAFPGDRRVNVTWEMPLTVGSIKGFEVVDDSGRTVCESDSIAATSCSFDTLDGNLQRYRVRGWNESGDGILSSATTWVASGIPDAPVVTASRILVAGRTAELTWVPAAGVGTAPISGFVLRNSDGTSLCTVAWSARSCTFTIPSPFTKVSLTALSPAGNSAAREVTASNFTPAPAPPGPIQAAGAVVTATQQSPTTVMVTWTSRVGTPAAVGIKASARVESRANAPAGTCANVAEPWCIITLTGTQPWDSVVVTATASNTYGTSAPISAPSFRVYSTPGAPFFLGVTPQDRKIDVVVGSIWHRQRSSSTEDTFLSDAERIASLCILITPIDDPDEVAHQLCQSKAAFEAFWGGGSGFYSFPRLENDRAYSVLLVGTNPAGTVTTASEVVIPGTDPAPPASPTNVKWTRQAHGNVLVWWKPVPRSSWNSQLPPRNVVRIGAQSWTVGGQTSQLLIAKSELLKPPAEGSPLSVIAANRAGDSAPAVGSPVMP